MTLDDTLGCTLRFIRQLHRSLPALACGALFAATPAQANDQPLTLSFAPSLQSMVPSRTELSARPEASPVQNDGSLPVEEIAPIPQLPRTIDLTTSPDNLWERIRNGFGMPNLNNDLVLTHQQWYMNRPDYVRRMVERSRRYMFHIVEAIEKRGMPMELALLPMVESAYNPMAYSRSHASGLWQFIPSTGKNFKLEQNWWVDDRRDIIASTSAALDYLQTIYEMHGDWQLALASYNWGEGAVGRAIAKNRAKGLPTDYENLTMPAETRNYVPKLQALKNILSNPRLLAQLDLPQIPNQPYFAAVAKPADMDVKVAAKLAEMPVDEFVALNPAHNRPVIKADRPLVLPAEKVERFRANLENNEAPLSSWTSYTLKAGEKLDKVAARLGVSVAHLKTVNGLPPKAKVGAGTTLLVPARDGIEGDLAVASFTPPAAETAPARSDARTDSRADSRNEPRAQPAKFHVVKKGDTLFSIARRYDVSVDELKRWNKLGRNMAAGTKLTVAPAVAAPAAAAKTTVASAPANGRVSATLEGKNLKLSKNDKAPANAKAAAAKAKVARYTIRKGDTLAGIAKKFKVEADDIKRWNKVAPGNLKPGQTITIQLAQND
ncbi:membrane-bound lytic murein transglycosylase D [Azospira oryzae]|uniref:Membrane-bound lytic murein transglycosylase D n=1 Tax=Azospira oryzae TaxID=146939 RepID=A0ABY0IR34_9RHOO|nr:LysM peptidoglycan-binding domain-containing protein [Azospira oryzae]RZT90035.1 membrane-bound lytic murein transglycosylase D [Azospira oryzae]